MTNAMESAVSSTVYDLKYKDKTYPVRFVFVPLCGGQMVVTRDLQKALESDFGMTPDCEAERLDQQIYAVVDSLEELQNFKEEEVWQQ